nr:hypothetical protein BaRGS_024426 [Batillaria attramentaria]
MTSEVALAAGGRTVQLKSLTCALCLDIYTSPRLLPCHHTFCLACIEGLAKATKGKSFPCPTCRKPTQVPPKEGVQAFQANFYITEEDLELARSGVDSAMCPKHSVEPLVFFCEDCDKVICIRCKLTDHDKHNTEDLPKVGVRCKEQLVQARARLEDSVGRLEKKVTEAQDNLKAAQAKAEAVKQQVDAQHDTLVAKLAGWRLAVLNDLTKVTASLEEQLANDARHMQQELDSLLQLRRRLDMTLEDPADAELVDMEREMRTGDGSEEELARIEGKAPTTTLRPGLHSDVTSIMGVDICRFLGRPVKLITPIATPTEVITPYVRCGEQDSRREVHALCVLDDATMHVTYGGTWTDYTDDSWLCVTKRKVEIPIDIGLKGRVTFKKYDKTKYFYSPYVSDDSCELRLNAKSRTMYQLDYAPSLPGAVKRVEVICGCPVEVEEKVEFKINVQRPFAFDVSSDGNLFAVLEEERSDGGVTVAAGKSPENAGKEGENEVKRNFRTEQLRGVKRVVRLYRRNISDPVSTYAAPSLPTDVCFWKTGNDEERLVVADWLNDSVHMVQVAENGECCFERYLACGCSSLVRPTAFDTDAQGNLWIGCGSGWVLKCERLRQPCDTEDSDAPAGETTVVEETHSDVDDDVELLDA